jgi:hypothetical protein
MENLEGGFGVVGGFSFVFKNGCDFTAEKLNFLFLLLNLVGLHSEEVGRWAALQ